MVQQIRERRAEWEVRNAGRQRSRSLETCSKPAGREAGSLDWRSEFRIQAGWSLREPDLC